jgi:hypothetical protein
MIPGGLTSQITRFFATGARGTPENISLGGQVLVVGLLTGSGFPD